jgi:hypothetical protein
MFEKLFFQTVEIVFFMLSLLLLPLLDASKETGLDVNTEKTIKVYVHILSPECRI